MKILLDFENFVLFFHRNFQRQGTGLQHIENNVGASGSGTNLYTLRNVPRKRPETEFWQQKSIKNIFSEPPYASNAHPTPKTREDTPF